MSRRIRRVVGLSLGTCPVFSGALWSVESAHIQPQATRTDDTEARFTGQDETRRLTLKQWGIDATEYARFETLMRGPRGAFSVDNISPLEVLGIHARTAQERRQYADRLVRLMYEDTERVLAFEYEVQAAWRRLNRPMFNPAKLPAKASPVTATPSGKRLALFVSTKADCLDCLSRTKALAARSDITGLDIYVTDTNDADAIRAFARKAGIRPKDVTDKRITLNQGVGLFARYSGRNRALPLVFVRDGKQLVPVADPGTSLVEAGQ